MPFDSYDVALEFLFTSTDYERMKRVRYNADTFSLARMERLLDGLGRPHRKFPAIHIAGTKGKGSTAAMIHAIARQAGLKTGLYTSPHLVDIRERIVVDGKMISPDALLERINEAEPIIRKMQATDAPTFFEIFTALAFLHFAAEAIDIGVLETGLGGRLDATNVIEPLASVITAISIDHTFQLGNSLSEIAGEKAGIIKSGVPVVSQPQPPEALTVIENTCRTRKTPLTLIGRDVIYKWHPDTDATRLGSRVSISTAKCRYEDIFLPLMGEHQAVNLATALAAVELAAPVAEYLTDKVVRDAIADLAWPGRMELVPGKPDILLDGAHNRASVKCLIEGLNAHFPNRSFAFVFGAAEDKDIRGMLAEIAGTGRPVCFTKTNNPRAAEPYDLKKNFIDFGGIDADAVPSVGEAIRKACEKVGRSGLVVICGSLYLVGEAKQLLNAKSV